MCVRDLPAENHENKKVYWSSGKIDYEKCACVFKLKFFISVGSVDKKLSVVPLA